MQANKSIQQSYKVGDVVTSPQGEKYEVLQRINSTKKVSQQPVSTFYQHVDTFIVKKQSNKLYYIMKRYEINIIDKGSPNKDSPMQSPGKEKSLLKQTKQKLLYHPNLMQVEEIFLEKKQNAQQRSVYLLLIEQYCEEGDLAYLMRLSMRKSLKENSKKQPFSEKVISKWLLQVLLALEHLHHNKLTHQLLNPQNIFLTPLGNLKLNEYYLLNSISTSREMKKSKETSNPIIDGYEPMLNDKKFKINQKKDIYDFGMLIGFLCNIKDAKDVKKDAKSSKIINLSTTSFSQDLNNIYLNCINVKKTGIHVKDILKTPYFLQVMREFITDKKLNVPVIEKIPIKKYMIHKKAISPKLLKNRKVPNQKPGGQINEGKLPKIQKVTKGIDTKPSARRLDKIQQKYQDNEIDYKKAMRASLEKLKSKIQLNQKEKLSREKRTRKNSTQKVKEQQDLKRKNAKDKPKILTPISSSKGSTKNSLLPPPPTLLNKKRTTDTKTQQETCQSQRTGAKSSRQETRSREEKKRTTMSRSESNSPQKVSEKPAEFKLTPEITFGKKSITTTDHPLQPSQLLRLRQPTPGTSLPYQMMNSKQSQLAKISQNLAKIFSDLKIRQDDDEQLSFQLDENDQEELRLTLKQQKQQLQGEDNLMKTYKGKFEQIISQLQERYQPNLQTIIEKTNQWDSNDFFTNRELLKKMRMEDGGSLLPSSAFVGEGDGGVEEGEESEKWH